MVKSKHPYHHLDCWLQRGKRPASIYAALQSFLDWTSHPPSHLPAAFGLWDRPPRSHLSNTAKAGAVFARTLTVLFPCPALVAPLATDAFDAVSRSPVVLSGAASDRSAGCGAVEASLPAILLLSSLPAASLAARASAARRSAVSRVSTRPPSSMRSCQCGSRGSTGLIRSPPPRPAGIRWRRPLSLHSPFPVRHTPEPLSPSDKPGCRTSGSAHFLPPY